MSVYSLICWICSSYCWELLKKKSFCGISVLAVYVDEQFHCWRCMKRMLLLRLTDIADGLHPMVWGVTLAFKCYCLVRWQLPQRVISLMDLENLLNRIYLSRTPQGTFVIHGSGQSLNFNKSFGGWHGRLQDFSWSCICSCSENIKRVRILSGSWSCDSITAISW